MRFGRSATVLLGALATCSVYTLPARSQQPARGPAALTTAIDAAIGSRQSSLGSARVGISVVDIASGAIIYERDSLAAYNTASNTKLVTTAAALALLGPDFRLRTEALGGSLSDKGVLSGDLYLRGRGNPGFGVDAMAELVRALEDAGVAAIEGGVVIDQSYFDDVDTPPHFDEQPGENAAFRAPVASTSLNFNMVSLVVRPARSRRGPAHIAVDPESEYIEIDNAVKTVSRGRTRLRLDQETKGGHLVLRLSGQIRIEARDQRIRLRIPDPTLYLGTAMVARLRRSGIKVGSKVVRAGQAPDDATLLALHESPPLAVLLRGLGKYSNNYVAEMILKVIGAERVARGEPATWQQGTGAVSHFLTEQAGFAPGSFQYGNGSGLFESNRFTPRQLTQLLRVAYRDFRWGPDYVASLSLGGADGTLSRRFVDTAAERLIRAKTGTLASVSALSGYAAHDGRAPVAFAILINDLPPWKGGQARALQDAVAVALVRYLSGASDD